MTSTPGASASPSPGQRPAQPPVLPPGCPPTRLTARSPEDLLAVVPVVLGFVPEESVVMLTFGAGRPFHARVDLPHGRDDLAEVVDVLRTPAVEHGVRRVVFVLYAADRAAALRVTAGLVAGFGGAGIEVLDVLRADGRRWYPLLHPDRDRARRGVAYDVTSHPFAAQSVLDGRVTLSSRAELAASVAPLAERVAAVSAARRSLPRRWPGDSTWARDLVRRHVATGTSPGDAEVARLLVAVRSLAAQEAARSLMSRATAPAHVGLWTDLVRRAPDDLLAGPAALLGLAAWLGGSGALAWCALDRCLGVEPDHPLGLEVADLLVHAVPPPEGAPAEGGRP